MKAWRASQAFLPLAYPEIPDCPEFRHFADFDWPKSSDYRHGINYLVRGVVAISRGKAELVLIEVKVLLYIDLR